ncbi:MAG: hypothetical protein JOZ05_20545 [Acetobacteraceae bacterium]|nr:hypothetical protein [Acetobacteraceae bacterium]
MTGALRVTGGIDPASTGVFQLADGASLEVAAARGGGAQMSFAGSSELIVDDPTAFGLGVGTSAYTGPLLANFATGDKIDIKQFAAAGATTQFDTASGRLQLASASGQTASLLFQTTSLQSGTFHLASDGSGGTLVTIG